MYTLIVWTLNYLAPLILIALLSPLLLLITLASWWDTGSPFFAQTRVGKYEKPFKLWKFRTMAIKAPELPTHQIDKKYISRIGVLLRLTKFDELPQLFNVLNGEMRVIGPRPNLVNQSELILKRRQLGIYELAPGITGLAQVKGVDMRDVRRITRLDLFYKNHQGICLDFYILIRTLSFKLFN